MIVFRLLAAVLTVALVGSVVDLAAAATGRYAKILHCAQQLPPAPAHTHDPVADINGASVLYAYGNLRHDFSLTANLTLPKVQRNRGLFYADWLILIRRGQPNTQFLQPFVQINFLRWSRYNYRPEVAYTWGGPDGKLIYADSSIFLDDRRPHAFGIAVHGARMTMSVDGRDVCYARIADFFTFDRPVYYQIGSEVARYGDQLTGTLTNVRIKSDDDATPHPYTFTCMYRDRGLAWKQTAAGTFVAGGTLATTGKRYFTGVTASSKCIDLSLKTYPVKR